MKIRVDLDNSTVGTQEAVLEFYNRRRKEPVAMDVFTVYSEEPKEAPGWLNTVRAWYAAPRLYVDTVKPYPFALDVIEAAVAAGHEVEIVSEYKHADTTPRKRGLLEKHRPALAPLLVGTPSGTKHLRGRVDIAIDDNPAVIEAEHEVLVVDGKTLILVIDQPYNRTPVVDAQADVRIPNVGVDGWLTIAEILGVRGALP